MFENVHVHMSELSQERSYMPLKTQYQKTNLPEKQMKQAKLITRYIERNLNT